MSNGTTIISLVVAMVLLFEHGLEGVLQNNSGLFLAGFFFLVLC